MTNNKVKKLSRSMWTDVFNEIRLRGIDGNVCNIAATIMKSIRDIAKQNSKSTAQWTNLMNEYMIDVSDYIRSQSNGKQCGVGLVCKSRITEDEEGCSCVVCVQLGTKMDTREFQFKCKYS